MRDPQTSNDYPSFQDAVDRMRAYLADLGWPPEIRWVDGENVSRSGSFLIVHGKRLRDPEAVRQEYWQAVPRRLGIRLHALAHDAEHSYCWLWAPVNRLDAEIGLMFDGLKMSASDSDDAAKVVGGVRFRWYRWRARDLSSEDLLEIPDSQVVRRPMS